GATVMYIAKRHRVSEHTVRAIRAREADAIAERKQRLMLLYANVAELSAERMEELAGQANLKDAGGTAGIATDKLLALTSDPAVQQPNQHLHLHLKQHLQPVDLVTQFKEFLADFEQRGRKPKNGDIAICDAKVAEPKST